MDSFKIVTDSTTDLPEEYIKENNLPIVYLSYIIDGETYTGDKQLDVKEFYQKMRQGIMPTTSQANPENVRKVLEEVLKENKSILCLAFSSGLSGTCNSFRIAAEELMEENKDYKIIVVDTLAASLGEGLLVHKALQLQKEGKSLEETAQWIEAHKLHLVHTFTVDDLFHLHRGGRVSKATAIVGSMINIKPILHVDNEGHLTAVSKVRGRKKALNSLVDYMEEKMGSFREKNDIIFISHGDCPDDANLVKTEIEKRFGIKSFLLNEVGPTIGAHSGPGTVALFFLGESR
ncbi:MAG: DegV family protein [Lachnospiraceae bacterium]|nr:DegV family protein [Lachnospiraceae bacterium]MDD7026599.1 DegV family protein [Lachnospiraceae bacterium]MDY5700879.1 DegV family protein [Lachnospiraceae bacterium]